MEDVSLWRRIATPVFAGSAALVLFLGAFGAWAAFAPLSSAAIASGVVSPEGSRRVVQHLEGGIVREILVSEGENVTSGQPVLLLEETQAKAVYERTRLQWWRDRATRERFLALQSRAAEVTFSPDIEARVESDLGYADFVAIQRQLFGSAVKAHNGRLDVLRQQIAQLDETIVGHYLEIEGNTIQLSLVDEELVGLRKLSEQGLALKSRLLELSREQARLMADVGRVRSSIASAKQKIAATEIEILNAETEFDRQNSTELTDLNIRIAQLAEQNTAAQDILERTVVRAPVDGTVVSLNIKTENGVIRPGQAVMEIVPSNEPLLIDTRLLPTDIDIVHVGLGAEVHLLPYKQRYAAPLNGKIVQIASDTVRDELSGEAYYAVKVQVDRNRMEAQSEAIVLTAGMPAEVYIVTGSRTMIEYLAEPIVRSFRRSFTGD